MEVLYSGGGLYDSFRDFICKMFGVIYEANKSLRLFLKSDFFLKVGWFRSLNTIYCEESY